ncbi:hypothetical protein EJB05_44839, partial [Eragrostis curvula]
MDSPCRDGCSRVIASPNGPPELSSGALPASGEQERRGRSLARICCGPAQIQFDSKNGSEEVSSESSRGSCAMSKNDEVPPEHLEPSLGTQTGNGMSFDPNAPAISAGTTIAPSETTNVDGMNNTNYDADQSDNNSDSSDEDDDTSESDDDSSDSSVHTPTSDAWTAEYCKNYEAEREA